MYIVYIQQVVKVLKNIYVINYKSNDHPLVNSLLGRIIDRFLGLSWCVTVYSVRVCVYVCVRVRECVSLRVCPIHKTHINIVLFHSAVFLLLF